MKPTTEEKSHRDDFEGPVTLGPNGWSEDAECRYNRLPEEPALRRHEPTLEDLASGATVPRAGSPPRPG